MQRTRNIKSKYFKRTCLWQRLQLKKHYRISEWRLAETVTKLYERYDKEKGWWPIYRTTYEIAD